MNRHAINRAILPPLRHPLIEHHDNTVSFLSDLSKTSYRLISYVRQPLDKFRAAKFVLITVLQSYIPPPVRSSSDRVLDTLIRLTVLS